ncbi:protein of unknown function [Burkholderia multivorans]
MLLGRSEGASHPTLIHDSETGGFPPPVFFQDPSNAEKHTAKRKPTNWWVFTFNFKVANKITIYL